MRRGRGSVEYHCDIQKRAALQKALTTEVPSTPQVDPIPQPLLRDASTKSFREKYNNYQIFPFLSKQHYGIYIDDDCLISCKDCPRERGKCRSQGFPSPQFHSLSISQACYTVLTDSGTFSVLQLFLDRHGGAESPRITASHILVSGGCYH